MDSAGIARFEAGRDRLASLAYRLLGSAADAEDAVQDAYLRWQAADRTLIEVPEAWLTKVVTNLCLDRLRSAQARHERAAGDWLPEPLLDGDPMLGPAETFEQRESVSLAVLTVMERLSPVERAAYVLREAFAYKHSEIAEILGISTSASQQHVHRARRRVADERRGGEPVDVASARRIVEEFLTAAMSGRTDRLVEMLTSDVTAVSDGAGMAHRLLRYETPERVSVYVRAGFKSTPAKHKQAGGTPALHIVQLNGSPAVVAVVGDHVVGAVTFDLADGKVAALRGIANKTRLARLNTAWRQHEPGTPVIAAW
ncbi:sigma-70 family RNA polymerase sigma factor [Streptomyces sp. NRRL WC-3742]|uniref:sigma-70 family RNA polymerase sigma factor n=1 Tax=Streptomyces sp. NRRL WC-3742 TaxID=1463934 RepID=UPI0004C5F8DD|nr:sigma-70 family RNA polymerase sigma factor [Streptomyces sp. NRRL WC-3742]